MRSRYEAEVTIGPYRFNEADVASTLALGPTLFELLVEGLDRFVADAVEPFRARVEALSSEGASWPGDPDAALAVLWREWRAAMRAVRATGAFGPSAVGTTTGLFTSEGGVPKRPAESIQVGWAGVVGDSQNDRQNHGRPWQAVCLWSTEVIDQFRAEGHPLGPGLAGENMCVTGLPWERVRPGVQLLIGDVLLEVSAPTIPCHKNAQWFLGGNFGLMHHRHGPISRMYATVVEPGRITVGDPVLLEPNPVEIA